MAYIRVVEEDEAQGILKEQYDAFAGRRGYVSNMVKAWSLRPEMLEAWHTLFRRIRGGSLGARKLELISLVCSALAGCEF
jgi:alkylhydroperoxidase family enzyme